MLYSYTSATKKFGELGKLKKKIILGILSGVVVIAIACTIYLVAGSASREKSVYEYLQKMMLVL